VREEFIAIDVLTSRPSPSIRLPNPRIPARIGLLRGMLRAPLCIEMLYQFHPPLWQRLLGSFLELRAQRVPKQIEQRWSS
jgi:hypothetical protein